MRKFMVNVNGTSYEVEVEEIQGGAAAPKAASAAPQAASAAPKAATQASGGQESVNAPMPGNILDVRVKAGDTVKAGQILLILEAMKMENEILAPKDGKIVAVNVAKGSTVNSGDALVIIG
ncbi:MAG: biotin/lipoyl-binding protein [Clostridia bacterium]|nr:biotin/lipoyl-binding protein [Clostridia bacterium]